MRFSVLLLLSVAQAWVCICAGRPTTREAWEASQVVFAGRVVSMVQAQPVPRGDGHKYQVLVEEPFKGTQRGARFDLEQFGSSCGSDYRLGDRVLLYLERPPGQEWGVRTCAGSGRLAEKELALLFLRGLPGSATRTRVAGEILAGDRGTRRLANVRVKFISPTDSFDVVSDAQGVFERFDVPPGRYKMEADLPPSYEKKAYFIHGHHKERDTIDLKRNGDAEVIVWADLRPITGGAGRSGQLGSGRK